MNRIVVLGSAGMLGHMVYLVLKESGLSVVGVGRNPGPTVDVVCEDDHPENLVDISDVVVNCIGVLNQACDRNIERAIHLNAMLPHILAKKAEYLIHISTDCVYSGGIESSKWYSTNMPANARTRYGQTKALGEPQAETNTLVLRQSIVGPALDPYSIGLLNWFLVQAPPIVSGYTNHYWNGITTLTLAHQIRDILLGSESPWGIMHNTSRFVYTKHKMLTIFNSMFDVGKSINEATVWECNRALQPTESEHTRVALQSELVPQMYHVKKWIGNHADLYPHYQPDFRFEELDSVAY